MESGTIVYENDKLCVLHKSMTFRINIVNETGNELLEDDVVYYDIKNVGLMPYAHVKLIYARPKLYRTFDSFYDENYMHL